MFNAVAGWDKGNQEKFQKYSLLQMCDVREYLIEYGTAVTTVLPILFLYLNTVIVTAGTFES